MEPIMDQTTIRRLCKITFYCVTLLAAIYAIIVALLLKPSHCAEAQCALVPHFAYTGVWSVDDGGSSGNSINTNSSACHNNNCICGIIKYKADEFHGSGTHCGAWRNSVGWTLDAYGGGCHHIYCDFRCVWW